MEEQGNNDESRPGATLLGVVGHQETAIGGGSPQRSKSESQIPSEGVSSTALSSGNNTTAETDVSTGTQWKQAPLGEKDMDVTKTGESPGVTRKAEEPRTSSESTDEATRRKVDITKLNETELLSVINRYINTMSTFAAKTRNVHKELKDTLSNTSKAMTQYMKIRNRDTGSKISKGTQTEIPSSDKTQAQELNTVGASKRVNTADASTDTPCWWPANIEQDACTSKQPEQCTRKKKPLTRDKPEGQDNQNPENLHERLEQSEWTEVTKKKRKPERGNRQRKRSDAVIIETTSEKYSEVLKKIKSGANMEVIGNKISGIRQAKSGGILMKIAGGPAAADAVRSEVHRIIDKEARIYSPTQQVLVEFRELDSLTSKEDLADEIIRNTSTTREATKILSLRLTYGETQSALVLMPSELAARVTEGKRMRIGLVYCSTRIRERWKRCFRCLKFGHEAKTCSGPDYSNCCRRCGKSGHRAVNCQAGTEETAAFRRSLRTDAQTTGSSGAHSTR